MAESTTEPLEETKEEAKPRAKRTKKVKEAAELPDPERELSKEEHYLLENGWELSASGQRWKCTAHARPYRNEMGQHEYANEHRAYTLAEALRIQKLAEEHVLYLKRLEEEREKKRIRPPAPV